MSIDSSAAVPSTTAPSRLPWWWVPAALFLVAMLAGLFLAGAPDRPETRSIYDATDHGTRAAYLLLEDLGYPVKVSRRLVQGRIRWVLLPTKNSSSAAPVADWVKGGGILALADENGNFARAIGLPVHVTSHGVSPIEVPLDGQQKVHVYEIVVSGEAGKTPGGGPIPLRGWPPGATEPLLSVYRLGRGEVWLFNRPELVRNDLMRASQRDGGGNAVVLSRLADAMRSNSTNPIYFDEYHHGLRERPGVVDLLLQEPLRWATLQSLVLLALVLWRQVPRFGTLVPLPPTRRRSKEEYLDALAHLLERKRAYADAVETVRLALVRDLERFVGLAAVAPLDTLIAHAARRRAGVGGSSPTTLPFDIDRLRAALDPKRPAPGSESAFLHTLHEFEAIRHDFFAAPR